MPKQSITHYFILETILETCEESPRRPMVAGTATSKIYPNMIHNTKIQFMPPNTIQVQNILKCVNISSHMCFSLRYLPLPSEGHTFEDIVAFP